MVIACHHHSEGGGAVPVPKLAHSPTPRSLPGCPPDRTPSERVCPGLCAQPSLTFSDFSHLSQGFPASPSTCTRPAALNGLCCSRSPLGVGHTRLSPQPGDPWSTEPERCIHQTVIEYNQNELNGQSYSHQGPLQNPWGQAPGVRCEGIFTS